MRLLAVLIFIIIAAAAMLASHQRKPFPLLVSEAHATAIVCNPVLVPPIPKETKVQKV